jgi:hypothetical protein
MYPLLLRTMADRPAVRGKIELYRLPCAARVACEKKVPTILRWQGGYHLVLISDTLSHNAGCFKAPCRCGAVHARTEADYGWFSKYWEHLDVVSVSAMARTLTPIVNNVPHGRVAHTGELPTVPRPHQNLLLQEYQT